MTDPENKPLTSTPPVNLLPSEHPRRSLWRWISLILGTVVLFLVIKIFFFPGPPGAQYSSTLLRPSKASLLDSVRNYFFNSGSVLQGEADDRVNVLLLGIGGDGHDGPYLSDTNLLLSLKPSTKEVALVSVPRDLTVDIPGYGYRKINNADAFGEQRSPGNGGDFARALFERTFNITIPYYVRVDFSAFREIIDAVGGVTVDVPRTFTDTQFPGMDTDYADNTSYQTVSFTQGTENMNGVRALQFARSRHGTNGEGSDFARARRQQLVINALKQKLLSSSTFTNPSVIQQIWNSVSTHIATNLNTGQVLYLATNGKDYHITKTLVFDNRPGGFLVDSISDVGAYILSPRDGNFQAMTDAIQNVFTNTSTDSGMAIGPSTYTDPVVRRPTNLTPSTTSAKVEVQNGTWRPGIAGKLGQKLGSYGYSVLSISNAFKRPVDKTTIFVLNPAVTSSLMISKIVGAPLATVLPDWLSDRYTSPELPSSTIGTPKYNKADDFLIILGSDYQE